VGGKELAPLCSYFKDERGSDTFAAEPPGRPNFRRGCKGMKVKTSAAMTGSLRLLFGLRSGALTLRLMRPTRVDRGHMNLLAEFARDYAALLISICALFLTISQTRATHKHNRLTVRPHIATYTDSKADLERAGVRLVEVRIANSGLGPAII